MPPIPENNTKTYFYDYQQGDFAHTVQMRTSDSATNAGADNAMLLLLPSIGALVTQATITGARVRLRDQDVAFPFASDRVGDIFGTGGTNPDVAPLTVRFQGRDGIGVRVSMTFFGYRLGTSAWRLTATEHSAVADAVATLNSGIDFFLTVANNKPIWSPYANINAHDHWVRRARG